MKIAAKGWPGFERKNILVISCVALGALACTGFLFAPAAMASTPTPLFPFTTLASLPATTGSLNKPAMSLVQGSDGNFYGMAATGGISNGGGVFSVTPTGTYSAIYSFTSSTGTSPRGALVQGSNGVLYGTLTNFSENNSTGGAIVGITSSGLATTLHTFANWTPNGLFDINSDGSVAEAGLASTRDGTLYGVTYTGGSTGGGTIYSVSTSGTFTLLYTFPGYGSTGAATTGANPNSALTLGVDGNLYGVTRYGGANGTGTIYRITPAGVQTTLQSFPVASIPGECGSPSPQNAGTLVLGSDGKLYGTQCSGGTNDTGYFYRFDPGTSTIADLYNFAAGDSGNVGGAIPNGSLAVGPDGNFYGTTSEGGTNGNGAIFAVTTSGTFTTVYNFSAAGTADGQYPWPLIVGTDNNFYGTATAGGTNGEGTVFKLQHLPQNDIVMASSTDGILDTRLINHLGTQQILQNVAQGYHPIAVGDFDGDGVPDILWTSANNDLYIWLGGKGSSTGFKSEYVGTYPAGWVVVGAGDINGDGKADILWINTGTHQFGYWLMDGVTATSHYITSYASGYYPIALGDFNGDGRTDVLWSSAKNDLYIWSSNVSSSSSNFTSTYAGVFPSGWKLVGTGDLDGDGISDLVWMKTDGTAWGYWLMNGAERKAAVTQPISGGSLGYRIVNVSDYNNDGLADLVWSNSSSLYLWTNKGTCASSSCLFTASALAPPTTGTSVFNNNVH